MGGVAVEPWAAARVLRLQAAREASQHSTEKNKHITAQHRTEQAQHSAAQQVVKWKPLGRMLVEG